jgi:ribulose-5-phosphate 4-epimerase/fuculose-1-phosphate aldolase
MMHQTLRVALAGAGRRLHAAGLAPGTSGNLSLRAPDGVLVTPTNCRLGDLAPDDLALLDLDGTHRGGRPASKEARLHLGVYRARPDARAIVHLHSPHSVAASCLAGLDRDEALPPFTAYALMRFGAVGLVPFFPPGSAELAAAVESAAAAHRALLLANHGSLIAGPTLESACADAEELEQAAHVHLLLLGRPATPIPERFHAALRTR